MSRATSEERFGHLLTSAERERRQVQADRRLASIGAEPQSTGAPQALGTGLSHRGRDQIFGYDARRGEYEPTWDTPPSPTIFERLYKAVKYSPIYFDDLQDFIARFYRWFKVIATHRDWREPAFNQGVDRNDVIFVAIHQAEVLSHNLREIANCLEEDIQRLDTAKQELGDLLPSNYSAPWTKDEETGQLWNNVTGLTHICDRPHYL